MNNPSDAVQAPECRWIEYTPIGAKLTHPAMRPEPHEVIELLSSLGGLNRATPWILGDLYHLMERWGEEYEQMDAYGGLSLERWRVFGAVAEVFPLDKRRSGLSWEHHRLVRTLENGDRERWLDRAEAEEMSSADLKKALASWRADGKSGVDQPGVGEDARRLAKAFAAKPDFKKARAKILQVMDWVEAIGEDDAFSPWVSAMRVQGAVDGLLDELSSFEPGGVCQRCDGLGCVRCRHTGWVPVSAVTKENGGCHE